MIQFLQLWIYASAQACLIQAVPILHAFQCVHPIPTALMMTMPQQEFVQALEDALRNAFSSQSRHIITENARNMKASALFQMTVKHAMKKAQAVPRGTASAAAAG